MVIPHAVQGESPFIDAAGYGGSAPVQGNKHVFAGWLVDILNTNFPGCPVRFFFSDGHNVAAEAQNGVLHAPSFQVLLHLVRNISFGNASQVDHHSLR